MRWELVEDKNEDEKEAVSRMKDIQVGSVCSLFLNRIDQLLPG